MAGSNSGDTTPTPPSPPGVSQRLQVHFLVPVPLPGFASPFNSGVQRVPSRGLGGKWGHALVSLPPINFIPVLDHRGDFCPLELRVWDSAPHASPAQPPSLSVEFFPEVRLHSAH